MKDKDAEIKDLKQRALSNDEMPPKLTLKQQLFARSFADPESPAFGNATRAAQLAGYRGKPGSNQLAVQGHANLRNCKIRRSLDAILDGSGCTLELGAKRLRQALDAEQVRVALVAGKFVYSKPFPDYRERRRAAELLFRLRALLAPSEEREGGRFIEQEPRRPEEQLCAANEPPLLGEVGDAKGLSHADSLLAQLREFTAQAQRLREKAERKGDLKTALAAVRELCRTVELAAKLRGELAQRVEAKILNMNLDPQTAKRIFDTFVARHPEREVDK